MNKKLEAIRSLKEKLLNMQNQLDRMITTNQQAYPQIDIKNYSSTPIQIRAPSNQKWKNPNYWGQNPILGKQNKQKIMKKNKRQKQVVLNSTIKQIMVNTDNKYYIQQQEQVKTTSHTKQPQYVNYFKSKRYQHRFFQNRRQTPRFQKIKTYTKQYKDPIINPQQQRITGKKISPNKRPLLSAKLMFTENPKSDPHIYTFANKISSLSPQHRKNQKNKSPNMRSIFNSLQKIESPKKKSCKKHYIKYFQETYGNNWV